ncbi:hypothetical protein MHU86_1979 [Fragilaria crotonensis]|nr:hypothetical protein MHU86_1979 [Fragilaria crotonensis]
MQKMRLNTPQTHTNPAKMTITNPMKTVTTKERITKQERTTWMNTPVDAIQPPTTYDQGPQLLAPSKTRLMPQPHGGQSYYPPTQLLQKALTKASQINMDDRQRFVFNFVLMLMATTCTQMSERAGLRKRKGRRGCTHERALATGES